MLGVLGLFVAYLLYAAKSWQLQRHLQALLLLAMPLFAMSLFIGYVPGIRVDTLTFLGVRFIGSAITALIIVVVVAGLKTYTETLLLRIPSPVEEKPRNYWVPVIAAFIMTLFWLSAGAASMSQTQQNPVISQGQDTPVVLPEFSGIVPDTISELSRPLSGTTPIVEIPEKYRHLAANRSVYHFTYYLNERKGTIDFEMYEGVYNNIRSNRWFIEPNQEPYHSFTHSPVYDNPVQKAYLKPLVEAIRAKSPDREEQARIAISLVQNIPYDDERVKSNAYCDYCIMPYVVLYENKGICGPKSALLSYLLKELGFDVAVFYLGPEDHIAVGIRTIPPYSYHNTGYAYIEATRPAAITDSLTINSEPQVEKLEGGGFIMRNLSLDFDPVRERVVHGTNAIRTTS
jgi:hypothetical protein